MDEEDDGPPMLVAADGTDAVEEALSSEMEDMKMVSFCKVGLLYL